MFRKLISRVGRKPLYKQMILTNGDFIFFDNSKGYVDIEFDFGSDSYTVRTSVTKCNEFCEKLIKCFKEAVEDSFELEEVTIQISIKSNGRNKAKNISIIDNDKDIVAKSNNAIRVVMINN